MPTICLKSLLLLWAGLLLAGCTPSSQTETPVQAEVNSVVYQNPLKVAFGDPYVLYDVPSPLYYMYGTGGGAKEGLSTFSSKDLVNRKNEGQVFYGNTPGSRDVKNFWAPEVFRVNGKYYMSIPPIGGGGPQHLANAAAPGHKVAPETGLFLKKEG